MSKAIRNMEVILRSMKRAKEEGMSTESCHTSMVNDELVVRHYSHLDGCRLTLEQDYSTTDIAAVWYDSVNEVKHVSKVDAGTSLMYYPLLKKLKEIAQVNGVKNIIISREDGNGFYTNESTYGTVLVEIDWDYKTLPEVVWNALSLHQGESTAVRGRDADVVLTDRFCVYLRYELEEANAWTQRAVLKEVSLEFKGDYTFETWHSWKEESVEA